MNFFNKTLILSLLGIMIFQSNLTFSMEAPKLEGISESDLSLHEQLMGAIDGCNVSETRDLIGKANINFRTNELYDGHSPITLVVTKAMHALAWGQDISSELSIMEILLNNGASVKDIIPTGMFHERSLLEAALSVRFPSLEMIKLLLNHGAGITERVLAWINLKRKEIREEILSHKNLREEALNNHTKEMLNKLIQSNNVFLVKFTVKIDPALVDDSHIKLAENNNPNLVPILQKAMFIVHGISKFREIGMKQNLPKELVGHIEKFILYS